MKRTKTTRSVLVGLSLGMLVILAGCGGSTSSTPTEPAVPTSTLPPSATTVTNTEGEVTQVQPTETAVAGPQLTMVTAPDGEAADKNVPTADPSKITPEPTYASSFDKNGDGYYDFDELYAAVDAEIGKWQWPAQYPATAEILMRGFASRKDTGDRWQVPYEKTIVQFAHWCGWEATWLSAFKDGDSAEQGVTLKQMQQNKDGNVLADPGLRDDQQRVIDQAALGNPALVQQNLTANCSVLRNFEATPGT